MPATTDFRTDSSPSVALTLCSCKTLNSKGRAPEFNWITNSRARSKDKPLICPWPRITAFTTGADNNSSSKKIAIGLPNWRVVTCSNISGPESCNSKLTAGFPS